MEKDLSKALNYTYRLLGIRPRSVFEMERKLKGKRFDEEIIEKVIDELKRLELLDDEKFAREWTCERLKYRPCGRFLVKKKLLEKGIAKEIINNVLEEFLPPEKEIELAKVEADKRGYTRGKTRNEDKQKLVLFLKSRGFGWEVISEALENDK